MILVCLVEILNPIGNVYPAANLSAILYAASICISPVTLSKASASNASHSLSVGFEKDFRFYRAEMKRSINTVV